MFEVWRIERLLRVAKSRLPWREGVARYLVRPIAAEWPLLKMQRPVASQGDEWQVSVEAVIGLQTLTGCKQPARVIRSIKSHGCYRPKFVAGTTH